MKKSSFVVPQPREKPAFSIQLIASYLWHAVHLYWGNFWMLSFGELNESQSHCMLSMISVMQSHHEKQGLKNSIWTCSSYQRVQGCRNIKMVKFTAVKSYFSSNLICYKWYHCQKRDLYMKKCDGFMHMLLRKKKHVSLYR